MTRMESAFTSTDPMTLIGATVESHKKICCNLGIFENYQKCRTKESSIGGEKEPESTKHLLDRYLNSAVRTQLAIYPVAGDIPEINEQLLAQLYARKLYIIDIASGHGAGTLSIINSLHHIRTENEAFSTDPLDIEIHALDFSPTSLNFYEKLIDILSMEYRKVGITIKLNKHIIDLRIDEEIRKTVEEIKKTIGENPQYLLICSAISGVNKDIFQKSFARSYEYIVTKFRADNSLFFWVEPQTTGDWIEESWQYLAKVQNIEYSSEDCIAKNIRFYWTDPHTKNVQPADTEYLLMGLAL